MKNTTSNFPGAIDDRIFFQDVNLQQLSTVNNYQSLISQGKYTDAAAVFNDSTIDYYGAWILNLLENRLIAIETQLQSKTKPILVIIGELTNVDSVESYIPLDNSSEIPSQYEDVEDAPDPSGIDPSSPYYKVGLSWIN